DDRNHDEQLDQREAARVTEREPNRTEPCHSVLLLVLTVSSIAEVDASECERGGMRCLAIVGGSGSHLRCQGPPAAAEQLNQAIAGCRIDRVIPFVTDTVEKAGGRKTGRRECSVQSEAKPQGQVAPPFELAAVESPEAQSWKVPAAVAS